VISDECGRASSLLAALLRTKVNAVTRDGEFDRLRNFFTRVAFGDEFAVLGIGRWPASAAAAALRPRVCAGAQDVFDDEAVERCGRGR